MSDPKVVGMAGFTVSIGGEPLELKGIEPMTDVVESKGLQWGPTTSTIALKRGPAEDDKDFFSWLKEVAEDDSGPLTRLMVRDSDGREVTYQILRKTPPPLELAVGLATGAIVRAYLNGETLYLEKLFEETPVEIVEEILVDEQIDDDALEDDGP